MGTVNYGTSDYITFGYLPISEDDLRKDDAFMKELKADYDRYGSESGGSFDDYLREYIQHEEEDSYTMVENDLSECNFKLLGVNLRDGDYEGFYIDIENDSETPYFDEGEKLDAFNEADKLQSFLTQCVGNYGMRETEPGWVTAYADIDDSLDAIKDACAKIREEISKTPVQECVLGYGRK